MEDLSWSALSAISGALAALIALITVLISLHNERERRQRYELKSYFALYARLIVVVRALQYVIRDSSKDAIARVELSLLDLVSLITLAENVVDVAPNLPSEITKCLTWIDELSFNSFKESVLEEEFSKYELQFRKMKYKLEDKLEIKAD